MEFPICGAYRTPAMVVEYLQLQNPRSTARPIFAPRYLASVEHNRGKDQRHVIIHFRRHLERLQNSALHLYRLPDRTESIPNDYIGRARDADTRMDSSSWGVLPLVLLDYGNRAAS